tara:strand:- start:5596 stop:5775 length:180 start_codon:yes stop_codon:yes gene_type:complete
MIKDTKFYQVIFNVSEVLYKYNFRINAIPKDKWNKLLHYSKVNKIDITIWTKLRIEKFE